MSVHGLKCVANMRKWMSLTHEGECQSVCIIHTVLKWIRLTNDAEFEIFLLINKRRKNFSQMRQKTPEFNNVV